MIYKVWDCWLKGCTSKGYNCREKGGYERLYNKEGNACKGHYCKHNKDNCRLHSIDHRERKVAQRPYWVFNCLSNRHQE